MLGKGAALKGARWNSIGVELIYTASNRSLAMAEVAVHFTLATLPSDYMIITIFIPNNISIQNLTTLIYQLIGIHFPTLQLHKK